MLTPATSYDALCKGFDWALPDRLNMAVQVCDAWASEAPDRVALIDLNAGRTEVSYAQLCAMADGLAHLLVARGVARGDRVGVLRSQDAWCAAAHIAIWKIGAISIPLFKLFKQDALTSRVQDAGAKIIVSDDEGLDLLASLNGVQSLLPEQEDMPEQGFQTVETGPEDPAVLI